MDLALTAIQRDARVVLLILLSWPGTQPRCQPFSRRLAYQARVTGHLLVLFD